MSKTNNSKVEKILDKVKKLLALAGNNPSEEEAKAASLKAQELMNEYNLSIADVDGEEKLEMTESVCVCGGDNLWKYDLSGVIAMNFRCKTYWIGKQRCVFFGYRADCEIAKEVFMYLFTVCKKRMTQVADKAYNDTGSSKGVRFSYTRGFVAGIKQVLDAQCTALMIITPPEVNESFEVKTASFKKINASRPDAAYFNRDHYNVGIQDGRGAMSARAVTG